MFIVYMADSGYIVYTQYLKDHISKNDLSNFKNHPDYTYMLEHVNASQGIEYLRLIKTRTTLSNEEIVEFCHKNDEQGNPQKVSFSGFEASPTSLRYIWQAHLILSFLKKINKPAYDIVEVGGGYGGLCFAISFFAKQYSIHISSYSIIDLKEPSLLQQHYLSKLSIPFPVHFLDAATYGSNIDKENLFFVSNYCFSEISDSNQKKYIEYLFPKVTHGFLAWNAIPVYNFGFPVYVEEEEPKTGEFNKIVYF